MDPLAEKMPAWSSYSYGFNAPTRFIDPDGRRPLDVIVSGPQANQAFTALKASSSLNLTYDSQTGKLEASGKAKNPADKLLLKAINDKNITVNLITTNSNVYNSKDGTLNVALTPGGFEGSTVNDDGTVSAVQMVNVNNAEIISGMLGESTGETLRHEVNEAYLGATMNPGGDYKSAYDSAHKAASRLDKDKGNHENIDVNLNTSNNTLEVRRRGDKEWTSLGKIKD